MSENIEYTLELKEDQYQYLTEMVDKYSLDDESKALRCLINFAIEEADHEESIFDEIRCRHC